MSSSVQAHTGQTHSRAVVWIDHLTARVFSMGLTGITPMAVHAKLASPHLHHKANSIGDGRVPEDPAFLDRVAETVAPCREVLILGPGLERTALMHHLQRVHPQIVLRLVACAHPPDYVFFAIGRRHFRLNEV